MSQNRPPFQLTGELDLPERFSLNRGRALTDLANHPDEYLANVDHQTFVAYLMSKHALPLPTLRFDDWSATHEERVIPPEKLRRFSTSNYGQKQPVDTIVIHIPLEGEEDLLHYRPQVTTRSDLTVQVRDGHLCFDIFVEGDSPDEITKQANATAERIKALYGNLQWAVDQYHADLAKELETTVKRRVEGHLRRNQLLQALPIPMKKREEVSATFTIPAQRSPVRVTMPRPEVRDAEFAPEPTLGDEIYQAILRIIHESGKVMERLPSIYKGKEEPAIRDLFIMLLTPHFYLEGASVTGETFNAQGKTDILIRWENHNVFAAECKYWSGEKGYLGTIDQLLSYLTWRDSKAAAVIFSKNKDIMGPLRTIEEVTSKHSNFLGFVGKKEESWFQYRFHVNGDPNRPVQIAVLVFNFPE